MDTTALAPLLGIAIALTRSAALAVPTLATDPRSRLAAHALVALLSLAAGVGSAYLAGPEALRAYDGSAAAKAVVDGLAAYVTACLATAGARKVRKRRRKVPADSSA